MTRPITYYIDTPSIRVFQAFAGGSLEHLDPIEVWNIHFALMHAALIANDKNSPSLDIEFALKDLDIVPSEKAQKCLLALNGFPIAQINQLVAGMLQISADNEGQKICH